MVLIVGGAAQGKLAFAQRTLGVRAWRDGALGEEPCVYGLHRAIRALPEPRAAVNAWLAAHPDGVLICDEVGCGITPVDRADRAWRELVGRICCELAERAEAVYRVQCGLGGAAEMTHVYLLRHGKTQGNLERRYIGSTDQPLCPQGRAELAGRTAPKADRLYVSPMRRCRETAALLYPAAPQEIVPDLRESSFGRFELHTYEELKNDPAYQAWLDTGGQSAPPGGEDKAAFQKRTVRAFQELAAQWKDGEAVAFVVHGGTIMALLEALECSKQFYQWQTANGTGFACRWEDGKLTVEGRVGEIS